MIDVSVIDKAVKLKKEMDAAYLVFKKTPTIENSATWTAATRTYNDYCIQIITSLVNERTGVSDHLEDITENFDKYRKCEQCGAELLFPTRDDAFIASSDFVEGIPGWCYSCLLEYCTTHECEGCTVNKSPYGCSFAEVKKLRIQGES